MDTNEDSRQSRIPVNAYICQSSPEKATKITNQDDQHFQRISDDIYIYMWKKLERDIIPLTSCIQVKQYNFDMVTNVPIWVRIKF